MGGLITIAVTVVNARLARRVAEASILGGHHQRLWEKQSSAYEEAVKEVLARQIRREALMSRGDVGNVRSHPAEEMRKAEEPEGIQDKGRPAAVHLESRVEGLRGRRPGEHRSVGEPG